MKTGICGLCKNSGIIKKSHLLPKSAYKQVRDHPNDGGGSPMLVDMSRHKFGRTDNQVCAHFLCGKCEGVFSQCGEHSVSKLWATHSRFPMLEILDEIVPASENSKRKLFKSTQFDGGVVFALYYFAVSVFWRAIAWPRTNSGVDSCKGFLNSAKISEVVEFLLRKSQVVNDLFLVVDVNTCVEMSGMLSMPARIANLDLTLVVFDVLGLRFMLYVGPDFPFELEKLRLEYGDNILITSSDHSESQFAKRIANYLNENDIE